MTDSIPEHILITHPDGYHDTSERAYKRRDLAEYTKWLFRDSYDEGWESSSDRWFSENPGLDESYVRHHEWLHYVPGEKEGEKYYDWELNRNIFGGLDTFFQKDSIIVDLGSGHGKVVGEINEKYKDRGVRCFGIDYRYGKKDYPKGAKDLLAGDFRDLPFARNAINRILSVESFPAWLPNDESLIERYLDEITRIASDGAIWRGTTFTNWDRVKERFLKRGWECYVDVWNEAFIAKLKKEVS